MAFSFLPLALGLFSVGVRVLPPSQKTREDGAGRVVIVLERAVTGVGNWGGGEEVDAAAANPTVMKMISVYAAFCWSVRVTA